MGFDDSGHISALEVKSWCLAGWFKDIADNDLAGLMSGLDQVRLVLLTGAHLGCSDPQQAMLSQHAACQPMWTACASAMSLCRACQGACGL